MNFISFGVFLLAVALLSSHYYTLHPPKSQILSVVLLLLTFFVWYGITVIFSLRTHYEPAWVQWIIIGAVALYVLGIRIVTGGRQHSSGTMHWLLFLSGTLVYVIVMFILVQTGTVTLH